MKAKGLVVASGVLVAVSPSTLGRQVRSRPSRRGAVRGGQGAVIVGPITLDAASNVSR